MKKLLLIPILFISLSILGQIPTGYYDNAQGLTGYQLKTALKTIITNGYHQYSYNDLYSIYKNSDVDRYYENDGTILDMYSEIPSGTDSYEYSTTSQHCGEYHEEGDCYNREHIMPQSVFSKKLPMKSDAHFVVPTDGYVNNRRSAYAFGEVSNPSWISSNGSKLGSNTTPGYSGTVFEPIDEFKGDIARMLFYFATRYEDKVAGWHHDMLNGTSDQVYSDWFLQILLAWNNQDPVSQREIDRNNTIYYGVGVNHNYAQHNRNPFIDHPEWVNAIWHATSPVPSTYVFYEDFEDCSNLNFVAYNEASNKDWTCTTTYGESNSGAMQMNGHHEDVPSKDWLITANAINFDNYSNESLSMYLGYTFGTMPLELVYSSDYDGSSNPSGFTWTPVPNVSIDTPTGSNSEAVQIIQNADISSISGTVYFAFKYYSNGSPTRWTVDNFKIDGDVNGIEDVLLSQNISIYPNPVHTGTLHIIRRNNIQIEKMVLYNMFGQVITLPSDNQTDEIKLTNVKKGVYFLAIYTKKAHIMKKVIVN